MSSTPELVLSPIQGAFIGNVTRMKLTRCLLMSDVSAFRREHPWSIQMALASPFANAHQAHHVPTDERIDTLNVGGTVIPVVGH
jgi:hypothetical protein